MRRSRAPMTSAGRKVTHHVRNPPLDDDGARWNPSVRAALTLGPLRIRKRIRTMPQATSTVIDGSLESRMLGNGPVRFGRGTLEKDLSIRHLANVLPRKIQESVI